MNVKMRWKLNRKLTIVLRLKCAHTPAMIAVQAGLVAPSKLVVCQIT